MSDTTDIGIPKIRRPDEKEFWDMCFWVGLREMSESEEGIIVSHIAGICDRALMERRKRTELTEEEIEYKRKYFAAYEWGLMNFHPFKRSSDRW